MVPALTQWAAFWRCLPCWTSGCLKKEPVTGAERARVPLATRPRSRSRRLTSAKQPADPPAFPLVLGSVTGERSWLQMMTSELGTEQACSISSTSSKANAEALGRPGQSEVCPDGRGEGGEVRMKFLLPYKRTFNQDASIQGGS